MVLSPCWNLIDVIIYLIILKACTFIQGDKD
uniref:Uncharacterized protein n=1 Tax=Rhizophora mucronata TaxID=61149 RepID=A0A2P2PDD8_RHIMU